MQPRLFGGRAFGTAFGQSNPGEDRGGQTKQRRGKCRPGRAVGVVADDARQCRTHGKPDPESRPHQPHAAGAGRRRGDVADVRLGGRNVSTGDAVDHAGQIDQPQPGRGVFKIVLRRIAQQQIADRAAELREDQHRPSAELVAEQPQHRCCNELTEREDRKNDLDLRDRSIKFLREKRQLRQDDPEAQQVDENDEKHDPEGIARDGSFGNGFGHRPGVIAKPPADVPSTATSCSIDLWHYRSPWAGTSSVASRLTATSGRIPLAT